MSVSSYRGNTYVGYLDISGFKQMMNDKNKLRSVMDKFYRTMFSGVHEVNSTNETTKSGKPITKINVVAVSDCAVLFLSKGRKTNVDLRIGLKKILKFVKYVNREFIDHEPPFMTTCSIAYGDFEYQDKKDWKYVRKNCMSGQAYIAAFLDSQIEKSKTKPGQCRILRNGIAIKLRHLLETTDRSESTDLNLLHRDKDYYYFYWMLDNKSLIPSFKKEYNKKFDTMYDGLMQLLRKPDFASARN